MADAHEPVHLVPITMAHAPAVQRLASDPAIAATSRLPHPYPPDGAVTWIGKSQRCRRAGTSYAFAADLDIADLRRRRPECAFAKHRAGVYVEALRR